MSKSVNDFDMLEEVVSCAINIMYIPPTYYNYISKARINIVER